MATGALCGNHQVDAAHVFLEQIVDGLGAWRIACRVTAEKRWPGRIIRCCKCDKPATRLDMHYPYGYEHNRCDQHSTR